MSDQKDDKRYARDYSPGDGVTGCKWCGREVELRPNGYCAACTLEHAGGIDAGLQARIDKIVEREREKPTQPITYPCPLPKGRGSRGIAVRKF